MAASAARRLTLASPYPVSGSPSILVGVTHSQTCLVLRNRLRALREAGFRVVLVSSPGALLDQTAAREGIEAFPIPMCRAIAPLADLISFLRLWRALGVYRPDVAEFSTPKAGLLGSLAAWLRRVPHRVYLLRGLKLETAHGIKRCILLAAERLAAACAHVVLCNSESLRARALALGIAPERKLVLLGEGSSHGVDIDRFSPGPTDVRDRLGLAQSARVVGFVGRLTRDKGVPELVEAFAAIRTAEPSACLLLVGWFDEAEDALDPALRARIAAHPAIRLTGFVSETAAYYRAMEVMVLPTRREGFPNAVLEAAASGIPVVTTEATGARDSVLHEVTGLLIPPGSPEAIAGAALALLRDPVRRLRMGRAARAWACDHFSNRRVLELNVSFYANLLGKVTAAGSGKAPGRREKAPAGLPRPSPRERACGPARQSG
jgi:glycosyltransferase involved in cell wall biosynthesis